jgi:hypothetical protein
MIVYIVLIKTQYFLVMLHLSVAAINVYKSEKVIIAELN